MIEDVLATGTLWDPSEVYLMSVDGTDRINLTSHPADDDMPRWSPDGLHIAFMSTRRGNLEIHFMSADGPGVTRLTTQHPARDRPWVDNPKGISFTVGERSWAAG